MTTASALCTQAAIRFKDPSNLVISVSQWTNYLNQCYKRANAASPLLPWNESAEETVTVLSGTRSIALPTDVYQVNWVYDATNDNTLTDLQGAGEAYRGGRYLRTDTGAPEAYRIRNTKVELYPLCETNISLRIECVAYPSSLSTSTTTKTSVAGAAAGNVTVSGIAVGDTLLYVLKCVEANPPTVSDLTSEFTVTATNTINNTAGTSSASETLAVGYSNQGGTGSPVWPTTYHEDLIPGMLALAYLDDGNADQYATNWKMFEASTAKMVSDMLMFRSERNAPVRDTMFG